MTTKSKLESYYPTIYFLKKEGRSFKDISEYIAQHHSVKSNKGEVCKFYNNKQKYKEVPTEQEHIKYLIERGRKTKYSETKAKEKPSPISNKSENNIQVKPIYNKETNSYNEKIEVPKILKEMHNYSSNKPLINLNISETIPPVNTNENNKYNNIINENKSEILKKKLSDYSKDEVKKLTPKEMTEAINEEVKYRDELYKNNQKYRSNKYFKRI